MNELFKSRLFDETIISTKEFQEICLVLKQRHNNKLIFRKKDDSNYDKFKNNIIYLVILMMKNILKDTRYRNDRVFCLIKKICIGYGSFNKSSNTIIIREEIINRIYDGDIIQLIVIFHEIYHFIVKYDIANDIVNEDTIKILKERLICIKIKNYKINNYRLLYEEKYADIKAINELLYLINMLNIDLSKKEIRMIKYLYDESFELYNYNKRIIEGINKSVNFNDLFNIMIEKYQEWLNYSQIKFEYEINSKIYVKK